MKIRNITILAAAMLTVAAGYAQNTGYAGGRVLRMSDFAISDMMQFSQYDYTFGTARSSAMGGAFTSLGADLSSMAINPAGLGMYRSSEFSVSPSLTWTKNTSLAQGRSYSDNYTRFALGNMGIALNLYQSTGPLTSFTFGFGYTKLADYNYNTFVEMLGQDVSINDIFAMQVHGMDSEDLSYESHPETYLNPNLWGAAMAWQTFAIDGDYNGDGRYWANLWQTATTDSRFSANTVGSIGEYDISGGFNFGNVFYFGMTIGIQDIYYRQDAYYSEWYNQDNVAGEPKLDYMEYDQYLQYSGTGVNFKLGGIVRPVEGLRVGFAVHTPTFVSLDREWRITNTFTERQNGEKSQAYSDYNLWRYNYNSPTRIMAGISYQIGNVALLAADYERVWYNGMRMGSPAEYPMDSYTRDMVKNDVKYCFKGANNFRVGIEIKPVPSFALRAGYAYAGSGLSDNEASVPTNASPVSVIDNPVQTKANSLTFGAGYRYKAFSVDVAYVNTSYEYTKSGLYWGYEPTYGATPTVYASDQVDTSMKRNIITMTLGFRF